jgi:hypothetical protein
MMATRSGTGALRWFDIAEVSRSYDPAGFTARFGLALVLYLLSSRAQSIEAGTARPTPSRARTTTIGGTAKAAVTVSTAGQDPSALA